MPITSSAKKALRAARTRELRNFARRSMVKSSLKSLEEAVEAGDAKTIASATTSAMSHVDRALKRGVIHKNTAARRKSKIAALSKKVVVAQTVAARRAKKG